MSLLFDITCLSAGDSAVVVVCGELDIARSPRLAAAINDVLRTKPAAVVIDLNQVDFVDSTALSVLLNARRRTLRQGIDLRLACEVRSTLRLLALTRLDNDFDVYPTRDAALSPVGESAA